MLKIKNKHTKKLVRGIIIFAAVAMVIQVAALIFATPGGLYGIYPYILYFNSDRIETGDSGIGEYFSMHSEIENAGLIILSVDTEVADSYRLAADYMKFLGRFTNISSVALYTQNIRMSGISEGIINSNYEKYEGAVELQKKAGVLPDQTYTFVNSVYTMNSRLSPDNKFSLVGIKGHDSFQDVLADMTTELYITPGGTSGEHREIIDAKTGEEYVALFKKHEEKLREILGEKFDVYKERCLYVEENAVEENYALNNLKRYAPAGEGTVYAILPERLCKEDSVFLKKAEETYGKVVVTDTVYYDCTTLGDEGEISRNDGDFPAFSDGIMIAPAKELEGFRNYYKKVVNSFSSEKLEDRMKVIGDAGEKTFFIIVGSGPVTHESDKEETKTVGTVNVAPG